MKFAIADTASLLGDASRAAMLLALMDGRALPAGELADVAGISAPAASIHLSKLARGGLVAVRQQGRHRYYSLAGREVAQALEALGNIAASPPPARAVSPERAALRAARTCYDHLAGVAGVQLADMLVRERLLRRDFSVTRSGERWFAHKLEIDVPALAADPRPLTRQCLDWTERRPHLAGALGAAMLQALLDRRWIARVRGSRVLEITPRGRTGLQRFWCRAAC